MPVELHVYTTHRLHIEELNIYLCFVNLAIYIFIKTKTITVNYFNLTTLNNTSLVATTVVIY